MPDFSDKNVLVTGSARGIGAVIVRRFAERGARVMINYCSSADAADTLRSEITGRGGTARVTRADVTDPAAAERLVQGTIDQFGGLDILVNNASDFLYKRVDELSIEEWRHTIESNLSSCFYCIRAAVPDMRKRRRGRIISLADMRAELRIAQPFKTPYMIAKSGVLQLTRAFAVTEAAYGVTVNAVSPGYIDSGNYSEMFKNRIVEHIPVRRLGVPDDIAGTVLFLASDGASYINGANIEVSGGAELSYPCEKY